MSHGEWVWEIERGNGHSTWTWTKHYPKRLPPLSPPLFLSLFLGSNSSWYVHKVKLFMASYTWYSISSTIHTPRRGQKPFWPHLNVSFVVSFFSLLFLSAFFSVFLCFFLQFFVSFVTIYEYVWIVLMKCSAKCTRLLNLFDLEFIVAAPRLSLPRFALPLYILEVATSLCLVKLSSCRLKFKQWRVLQIG